MNLKNKNTGLQMQELRGNNWLSVTIHRRYVFEVNYKTVALNS